VGCGSGMGVFKAPGVVPSSFANFWSNPVNITLFPLPEFCLQGWEAINQSASDQPQGWPRNSLSQ